MAESGREIGRSLLDGVRGYVARAMTEGAMRLDGLQKRLEALPTMDAVRGEITRAIASSTNVNAEVSRGESAKAAEGASITIDDMRPILEAEMVKWALDFERRAQDIFREVIERMPKPKDGLGVDDLSVEHDGDGVVMFRFLRDGVMVKEFTLRFPCFKDRGVFETEETYREGHGVTWGGSFFIAQKDSPFGKPGESDDWRLAVKRGRDGKDAKTFDDPSPALVRLK